MANIDSGPINLDWSGVRAGDRNREVFQFTAGGVPWDLTGAVLTAQARKTPLDPVVALTAVVEPVEPAMGLFAVSWDGEQVRSLLDGEAAVSWRGVWDLQVLMPGETLPDTILEGSFEAVYDVTREEEEAA